MAYRHGLERSDIYLSMMEHSSADARYSQSINFLVDELSVSYQNLPRALSGITKPTKLWGQDERFFSTSASLRL